MGEKLQNENHKKKKSEKIGKQKKSLQAELDFEVKW